MKIIAFFNYSITARLTYGWVGVTKAWFYPSDKWTDNTQMASWNKNHVTLGIGQLYIMTYLLTPWCYRSTWLLASSTRAFHVFSPPISLSHFPDILSYFHVANVISTNRLLNLPSRIVWIPIHVHLILMSRSRKYSVFRTRAVNPTSYDQPPTWKTGSHIFNPWDRVVQLYFQTLGTHFSRRLRHAWATVRLF